MRTQHGNKGEVSIVAGFDGSCPRGPTGIKRDGQNIFTLYPTRDGDEGRGNGFSCGVEIRNRGVRSRPVTLRIDWEDESRSWMAYRDFMFVKHEEDADWKMLPVLVNGSVSTVVCDGRPGGTLVFLNPRYGYDDYESFMRRIVRDKRVTVKSAGTSREGRDIGLAVLGRGTVRVLIMARNHAYESAGSYCLEGMTDWLLSGEGLSDYLLDGFTFCFLPMTNPDGVYHGLSRFSASGGADLNRIETAADPAHDAIRTVLDETRPHILINIHNWMGKFQDGLLCLDGEFVRKVAFYMPDQVEYGKRWYIEDWAEYCRKNGSGVIPSGIKSWKDFCHEKFNTLGLTFEFPWFGRNGRIMRETGIKALRAVLFSWMNR